MSTSELHFDHEYDLILKLIKSTKTDQQLAYLSEIVISATLSNDNDQSIYLLSFYQLSMQMKAPKLLFYVRIKLHAVERISLDVILFN